MNLKDFVGTVMRSLAIGRTLSDQASLKIADEYLNHEFLRGFPVPRMEIRNAEFELKFAVETTTLMETLLQEPEVRNSIRLKFRSLLTELPNDKSFEAYFSQHGPTEHRWQDGIDRVEASIQRVLTDTFVSQDILAHKLVLILENFFYEAHYYKPKNGLLASLFHAFSKSAPEANTGNEEQGLREWAKKQVASVLTSIMPDGAEADQDLNILVGASQLQGMDAECLQSIKFSTNSNDRKWVSTEVNGKKSYVLDH